MHGPLPDFATSGEKLYTGTCGTGFHSMGSLDHIAYCNCRTMGASLCPQNRKKICLQARYIAQDLVGARGKHWAVSPFHVHAKRSRQDSAAIKDADKIVDHRISPVQHRTHHSFKWANAQLWNLLNSNLSHIHTRAPATCILLSYSLHSSRRSRFCSLLLNSSRSTNPSTPSLLPSLSTRFPCSSSSVIRWRSLLISSSTMFSKSS